MQLITGMSPRRNENRKKYQYSERLARPENVAYLLKHTLIASPKETDFAMIISIVCLHLTRCYTIEVQCKELHRLKFTPLWLDTTNLILFLYKQNIFNKNIRDRFVRQSHKTVSLKLSAVAMITQQVSCMSRDVPWRTLQSSEGAPRRSLDTSCRGMRNEPHP